MSGTGPDAGGATASQAAVEGLARCVLPAMRTRLVQRLGGGVELSLASVRSAASTAPLEAELTPAATGRLEFAEVTEGCGLVLVPRRALSRCVSRMLGGPDAAEVPLRDSLTPLDCVAAGQLIEAFALAVCDALHWTAPRVGPARALAVTGGVSLLPRRPGVCLRFELAGDSLYLWLSDEVVQAAMAG